MKGNGGKLRELEEVGNNIREKEMKEKRGKGETWLKAEQ